MMLIGTNLSDGEKVLKKRKTVSRLRGRENFKMGEKEEIGERKEKKKKGGRKE